MAFIPVIRLPDNFYPNQLRNFPWATCNKRSDSLLVSACEESDTGFDHEVERRIGTVSSVELPPSALSISNMGFSMFDDIASGY